jgi:membrane protein YdbS with pleckstrin-like domain
MECSAEVSTQAPIGLTIMEKLIGLIMIAVGALWLYTTYTNMTSISMSAIFLVLSAAMIGIGILLVIAKFE